MIALDFDGTLSRCLTPFNGKDVDKFNDPESLMAQAPLDKGLAFKLASRHNYVVVTARHKAMSKVIFDWLEANGIADTCKGICAVGEGRTAITPQELVVRKLAAARLAGAKGIVDDSPAVVEGFRRAGLKAVLVNPSTGKAIS